MNADVILYLISRYHHLLSLESARLVKSGFVEAWVNSLDEESWALIHKYLDCHQELASGAAKDLRDESLEQPTTTVGTKGGLK